MTDWRYLPDKHVRPERTDGPNWHWLEMWEQENPHPGSEGFEAWYKQKEKMRARIWVAYCLPDFLVWDWSDRDVKVARKLLAGHVCGVCGAADDPGCYLNC